MATIAATAIAVPRTTYSQEALSALLRRFFVARGLEFDLDLVEQVFRSTAIQTRAFGLPVESMLEPGELGDFYEDGLRAITNMSGEAVERVFADAAVTPKDVALFSLATTTIIAAPTVEARLMNRLPFQPSVKRMPLVGLGCMGGAAAIARVADYLRGHPDEVAVLVAAELCSQAWQGPFQSYFLKAVPRLPQEPGLYKEIMGNVVSAALFSDGAGAAIVAGERHPLASSPGPRILDSMSNLVPHTEDVMGIAIGQSGIRSVLRSDVPQHAGPALGALIRNLLARHGATAADVGHWLLHPGGPKVIEAVQREFSLTDRDTRPSRDVLEKHGNVSSATVLFMLDEARRNARPAPGTLGVLTAMGPGFSQEAVLLRW